MKFPLSTIAAAGLLLAATQAGAVTITFENLAAGTVLGNQYAAQGVVFSPNPLSGASNSGSTSGTWASNTDMTIVSSLGSDAGGLGVTPSGGQLVSGNILRNVNAWIGSENGDANFLMAFSTPISSISVDFAGVNEPAATKLLVYNGSTLLSTVTGTVATGQYTLSYSAPTITRVIVAPGSYDDWVGVDNIVFAPVPEPATWASMALGLTGVLLASRRRRAGRSA